MDAGAAQCDNCCTATIPQIGGAPAVAFRNCNIFVALQRRGCKIMLRRHVLEALQYKGTGRADWRQQKG
jgi:hypothetical protein